MAAFFILGLLGLLGAIGTPPLAASDDGVGDESGTDDDALRDEPFQMVGTLGEDDVLTGGSADDILTGNFGDMDVLDGQDGDDLLFVQNGNTATGGTGSDTFDITNGQKSVITDFDPEEDALQVLFLNRDGVPEAPEKLSWRVSEDGVELHASEQVAGKQSDATHLVTLLGLSEVPEDTVILFAS